MDISKAWGYGAVAIPQLLFWQGFVIVDPASPEMMDRVHDALLRAEEALAHFSPDAVARAVHELDEEFQADKEVRPKSKVPVIEGVSVEGILGAALTELFFQSIRHGVPIGGIAENASAFSVVTGHRFWMVNAKVGDRGIATSHTMLDVTTPEAAREEINRRVLPLKMGQALKQMKP